MAARLRGQEDRRGRTGGHTIAGRAEAWRQPGWPGLFDHPRSLTGLTAPRREMERKRRGESRPCEAGVETLSTQPPPSSPWRPQRQARQRAKHPADAARRAEGRRCWRQDQPRGHDRLVRRSEGRNSKPSRLSRKLAARSRPAQLPPHPPASERKTRSWHDRHFRWLPSRPKPGRARRVMIAAHAPQFCSDPINGKEAEARPA